MCGISGAIKLDKNAEINPQLVQESINSLHHRGPDFNQCIHLKEYSLAHARLSIIDKSEDSNQPMFSHCGRYQLIFNGEIYNFKSLKESLSKEFFINFKTKSDTEVLLYALIHWGREAIQKLNGFFAFCFSDRETNTHLIARDRFGIKPLVYVQENNVFYFASELKALYEYNISKEIDPASVNTFLQFSYIPAPHTIFKKIYKLNPGELIEINANNIIKEKYYSIRKKTTYTKSFEDATVEVRETVFKSVEKRMISDVPLGSFLSGGIDSSIISFCAKQFDNEIQTFSLGFENNKILDESETARNTSSFLGTKHHSLTISSNDFKNSIDSTFEMLDEPFADSSAIAVNALSKKVSQHLTVALSGDGADELFSGYNKHSAFQASLNTGTKTNLLRAAYLITHKIKGKRNTASGNKIRQLNKFASGLKLTNEDRYLAWASFTDQDLAFKLTKNNLTHVVLQKDTKINSINDMLLADLNMVLSGDMLRKVDSMSMSHSIEVRTPFLDHNLVDLVTSMPSEFKLIGNEKKRLLKSAFADDLPNRLFSKPKHGFEVPVADWLTNNLKSELDHLLSKEIIETQGIFDYSEVTKCLFSFNKSHHFTETIWALFCFQKWYFTFFNEKC